MPRQLFLRWIYVPSVCQLKILDFDQWRLIRGFWPTIMDNYLYGAL